MLVYSSLLGIWFYYYAHGPSPSGVSYQGPSDPTTTTSTSTSTSFSMYTRCACPIAWGCHVNSFCRQNLVAVLTPTTRFSTNLVPRLRVHYRCKGELKGLSLNARIHCEMFRATCLTMFWRLGGILCCLSTKHSRDWQNVITSYSQKLLKYFCCELTTATTVSTTAKTRVSRAQKSSSYS